MAEPHITYTGQQQQVASAGAYGGHGGGYGADPVAVAVAEQAMADPATREYIKQQAVVLGGHAAVAARHYGHKGLMAFQDYIQQGPKGISMLCFVGGVGTSIVGGMNVANFFGSVTDPFHYVLSVYMFLFGIATACIEADTDRIGQMIFPFDGLAEPITRSQAWLHEECRLLCSLRGRGLFYLYQGTLMVTQCLLCMWFLCGLYNVMVGILCIMMSFGMTPDIEGMVTSTGLVGPAKYDRLPIDGVEEGTRGESVPLNSGNGGPPPMHTIGSMTPEAPTADEFPKAEVAWQKHKERLSGKTCRALWAYHQQATIGDCNIEKPTGMFNGSSKEQWRLWSGLKGIHPEEAKTMFIERLRKDGQVLGLFDGRRF